MDKLLLEIYNHSDTMTTKHYIGLTKQKVDKYYDDMGEFFDNYVCKSFLMTEKLKMILDMALHIWEIDIPYDAPRNLYEIFLLIENVKNLIISEISDGEGGIKPQEKIDKSGIILYAEFGMKILHKVDIENVIEELKPYFKKIISDEKRKEHNPSYFSLAIKPDVEYAERRYIELDKNLKEFYSKTMIFLKP